ncbi:MAG: hypothetical protein IJR45_07290 [Firmicutes bacterium]|nr:hypothetical protein [Bacillota bacterium]MBQ9605199.1 hypothetical protein [Bacillota bacterium]
MKNIGKKIEENEMGNVSGGALLEKDIANKFLQDEINGMIEGAKQTVEDTADSIANGVKSIFR